MTETTDAKTPMFLRGLWYFAAHSADVKPGGMTRRTMLEEPVLIAREPNGKLYALRDVCPHRGVPLSAGKMKGGEVECPYHGWRFGAEGKCTHIPSLVDGQPFEIDRIRVRKYPAHEEHGLVWVYMASNDEDAAAPPPPPVIPLTANARPRLIEAQSFPCEIDHAVVGLMDPAHGPYVHNSWWWRGKTKAYAKKKQFVPSDLGFTMVSHPPSSNSLLYRLLGGGLTTTIAFSLPSMRIEDIRAGRHQVLGVTTVTPVTATESMVTQTMYWTMPWLTLLRPILRPIAKAFLGQDRDIVALQTDWMRFKPTMMLIRDADVLAMWYYRLKKEWAEAKAAGRPFVNPVPATTLQWKS